MSQGRFKTQDENKMMSAIDMMRDQKAPSVIDGEKVLKHSQAAYDGGGAMRSSWKMGSLFLTEKKLIFLQGQKRIFESDLNPIVDISIIDRDWIPGRMVEQVCLTRKRGDLKRRFYFHIKKPQNWKEAIEKQIGAKTG